MARSPPTASCKCMCFSCVCVVCLYSNRINHVELNKPLSIHLWSSLSCSRCSCFPLPSLSPSAVLLLSSPFLVLFLSSLPPSFPSFPLSFPPCSPLLSLSSPWFCSSGGRRLSLRPSLSLSFRLPLSASLPPSLLSSLPPLPPLLSLSLVLSLPLLLSLSPSVSLTLPPPLPPSLPPSSPSSSSLSSLPPSSPLSLLSLSPFRVALPAVGLSSPPPPARHSRRRGGQGAGGQERRVGTEEHQAPHNTEQGREKKDIEHGDQFPDTGHIRQGEEESDSRRTRAVLPAVCCPETCCTRAAQCSVQHLDIVQRGGGADWMAMLSLSLADCSSLSLSLIASSRCVSLLAAVVQSRSSLSLSLFLSLSLSQQIWIN